MAQWVLGLLSGATAASLKAQPEKVATISDVLSQVVTWSQDNAWWIVPVMTLLLPILQYSKSRIGDPTVWDIIHKLLDEMRAKVYPDVAADHHHRVTLFQHKPWCVRWSTRGSGAMFSGWLVPVERSGERTQNPKVVFKAPNDNPDLAEGVAGLVWASGGSFSIERLPELTAESKDSHFAQYAERTKCSEQMLREKVAKGKILARSYWGTVVKKKNGLWGIVLIDSRNPELPDETDIEEIFKPIGVCLNKLLEVT